MSIPSHIQIKEARSRIAEFAHKTPVFTSNYINSLTGGQVFFKCENFQKGGAFKFRGAANTIFSLPDEKRARGVATHSSGNHAQAVALSARLTGIPAYIVMPDNAPKVKIEAVKAYGAEIAFCAPTLEARESTLKTIVAKTGAHLVHPYNDAGVITGQATCAHEFLEQIPQPDMLITPVGGGGLLSGSALSAHYINPEIKVMGAEPKNADDAFRSFKSGKLIPANNPDTIADGLKTSLGEIPFSIIQKHVANIATVSESEIIEAMKVIWQRMKIIIESSAAVPVAALLSGAIDIKGKKAGVILSGGNVDLDNLPW